MKVMICVFLGTILYDQVIMLLLSARLSFQHGVRNSFFVIVTGVSFDHSRWYTPGFTQTCENRDC